MGIGAQIIIDYPAQVSIPDVENFYISDISTSTEALLEVDTVGRRVQVTTAFEEEYDVDADDLEPVTLVLNGFVNPSSQAMSDSFTIITLTLDGYYVDSADYGLVLNSDCNYPCEGCSLENASECTSCFGAGTLPLL